MQSCKLTEFPVVVFCLSQLADLTISLEPPATVITRELLQIAGWSHLKNLDLCVINAGDVQSYSLDSRLQKKERKEERKKENLRC